MTTTMPKWEYRIVQVNGAGRLEAELNKLGEYGWEVVGMEVQRHFGVDTPIQWVVFFLKRPKVEQISAQTVANPRSQ